MKFYLLLCFLFCCSESALACNCVPLTVEAKTAKASAVFIGRVTRLAVGAEQLANLEVIRAWKNARPGMKIDLSTGSPHGGCGIPFALGKDYLIFAVSEVNSKKLRSTICNGSVSVNEGADTISKLDALSKTTELEE